MSGLVLVLPQVRDGARRACGQHGSSGGFARCAARAQRVAHVPADRGARPPTKRWLDGLIA
eukprot:1822965-Prymnesium_polylepis.1